MPKDLAIVLNNGSLNSAVVTALAAQRFRTVLLYGQMGEPPVSRARGAYEQQVGHFKPYREHAVMLAAPETVGPAAAGAPDPRQARAARAAQIVDLLPLLAAATRLAVQYSAATIYLGLRVGGQGDDLAQASEAIQIWNELVQMPCNQPDLEIVAPLLELDSWQVVDLGFQVGAPFDRTWNCLEEGPEPCWTCRACRAREGAFQQSGKPDPQRGNRRA